MSAARVALASLALDTKGASRWAGWRSWLGWLLPLVVAVPALWPVATHQFLETDDSRPHLNRLVGFTALLSQGVLYPRLYPDLASGYGYPLGLFYPPLSLYVGGVPLLLGGDATAGLRFAYATALVVAALGAFVLGRAVSGCLAGGLLGSAMLTYAPYVLALVYRRGALAELWGVALAPWVFWALWRWPGGRAGLLVAALALAGVLLAHNLVALIIWPLAATWWVLRQRAQGCLGRSLLRGGLPFLAAAALAAPYWLPATVLAGAVSLDRFHNAPLHHLTPPQALVDWSPLARYERFQLGALQLTVALAGVAVALRLHAQRGLALFGLGSAILLVLLTAAPAAPLWDALPFLDPLQFPFRLLGPVALLLALAALPLARAGLPLSSGATLLLAAAALPALPVPARPIDSAWLTTAGVARWEFVDRSVGTTIAREYLPRGVATSWRYPADGFFGPAPNSGEPLARVQALQVEPLRWELSVEAAAPTVIRFHTFALPGWQASIDGRAAGLSESGRLRLLTLELPAG
ncbi:MAG: hypothetical protein K6U89_02780 [Chloroflexi bacterium]|nr:hypothetical protein [Chloroflexota bacterium]